MLSIKIPLFWMYNISRFNALIYLFYPLSFLIVLEVMSLSSKPRSEMTQDELAKREEEEFNVGPLSILTHSVNNNAQVNLLYT